MSVAESYIAKPVAEDATLTVAGSRHELPVRKGTLGPDVIDITTLYVTHDPDEAAPFASAIVELEAGARAESSRVAQ